MYDAESLDDARNVAAVQNPDNVARELIRLAKLSESEIAAVHDYAQAKGVGFLEAAIATRVVSREFLLTALSKRYNYPIIQNSGDFGQFSKELVVGHEPFGPAAEIIRSIRTSIVSSAVAQGVRSFAIVGPREGQGASFLAGNLAVAFAQMSVATLLIDANLRDPRIASMFGVDPDHEGLADVLLNRDLENPPIIRDIMPGLSLLTSGGVPPNPQELLASASFMTLTANVNRDYGVVIYDSPSAMDFGDAYIIASRVGAVVLAGRVNHVSFADVKKVSEQLRSNQCTVVGSVANDF